MQGEAVTERLRNLDGELRAEVMLEAALARSHHFTKNGHVLPVELAFQSAELVTNLVKLGLFSMNMPNMSEMEASAEDGSISFNRVPAFLLAVGIDYAIEVAPTVDMLGPGGAQVISLDALADHIDRIETHFGAITIDADLINRITMLTAYRIAARNPDPESAA
ncbi:hypothetical protein ACEUZ9_004696 [Paracoccus litorisediminis]|uniref:hypothetical protein n=1 Tax=Paracoccus litorisediminis TaxID=2006130 RepID=UPI003733DCF8